METSVRIKEQAEQIEREVKNVRAVLYQRKVIPFKKPRQLSVATIDLDNKSDFSNSHGNRHRHIIEERRNLKEERSKTTLGYAEKFIGQEKAVSGYSTYTNFNNPHCIKEERKSNDYTQRQPTAIAKTRVSSRDRFRH